MIRDIRHIKPWEVHRIPEYFNRLLSEVVHNTRSINPDITVSLVSSRVVNEGYHPAPTDFIIYFEKNIEDPDLSGLVDDLFNIGGLTERRNGYVYVRIVNEDFVKTAPNPSMIHESFNHKVHINLSLIKEPIEPDVNFHRQGELNVIPIGDIYSGRLASSFRLDRFTYDDTLIESVDRIKTNLVYKTYIEILNTALAVFNHNEETLNKLEIINRKEVQVSTLAWNFRFNGHKGCGGY